MPPTVKREVLQEVMIEKVKTRIAGLDELLDGGFPKGRVISIIGSPGTGKTILSTQFIMNGILDYGENGLYISLDERKQHYIEEMASFGWDLEKLEKEGKFAFIDASPIKCIPGEVKLGSLSIGKRDFSLLSLIDIIKTNVKAINAKRIVLDSIGALIFQYPVLNERRTATIDLIEALIQTEATSILTSELKNIGENRIIQDEEYLSHGVILLKNEKFGDSYRRIIQLEKMRGIPIDTQPHPFKITESGIKIYEKERLS